ncbi:MAG TPA: hypothetical protein DEA52_04055 [Clostridiaceae bacterium]|nr:hypothetical protein [Clostridiaceae bacterium]
MEHYIQVLFLFSQKPERFSCTKVQGGILPIFPGYPLIFSGCDRFSYRKQPLSESFIKVFFKNIS